MSFCPISRFKTLTRAGNKAQGPDGDREYALIHHTYYAEFDSEFTSCTEGQEIEVVSRLPDSTVVVCCGVKNRLLS